MAIMTFGPKHSLHKQSREASPEAVAQPQAPIYVDKIVEVPTIIEKEVIKYIDRVVEVPVEKVVERVVEVVREVPVEVEKIVERLIEVPIEKIKEVPSFVDRIVVKHTQSIPKYVLVLLGVETLTLVILIGKIILGG